MRKPAPVAAIAVLTCAALGAQSKPADVGNLTYDVVSIKLNTSGAGGGRIGREANGSRWIMVNVATSALIKSAYPTKVDDLVGAPEWVNTERYDVEARATFEPTREQQQMMLRALLADRFRLRAHYEAREQPIYHLVVARGDGRLGAQLHRIDIDCAAYKPKPPAPGEPARPIADAPVCGYRMRGGTSTLTIVSGGQNMQSLADSISGNAGRAIIDKTGLTGYYAYKLEFGGGNDEVSIFTALQEQLGLKLEPARGPLDAVVIDHIERPSEN